MSRLLTEYQFTLSRSGSGRRECHKHDEPVKLVDCEFCHYQTCCPVCQTCLRTASGFCANWQEVEDTSHSHWEHNHPGQKWDLVEPVVPRYDPDDDIPF